MVKNGGTHDGKQRFRCQDCSGQFVENPTRQLIADQTRELINRLLKQRLAIAAI
ncbi:MAG: IS1 family transposase, partial [Cyanobacteria bacterium QH_10_48_56]